MAKKTAPRKRMGRNAEGKRVPQVFFGGWIEQETYRALQKIGVRMHKKMADVERDALREYAERHNGEG